MYHQPVWNRRKEIMLGTQAKVSPCRAIARRTHKIQKTLGPAAVFYFWMLERIGSKDHTKFYIKEAAKSCSVTEKTIDRWTAHLKRDGWIAIRNGSYAGRRSYSTYFLLPINHLIDDCGTLPKKGSQRGDTDDPTVGTRMTPPSGPRKEAEEVTASSPSPLHSSPPPIEVAKQAEAGHLRLSPPSTPPQPSAPQGSEMINQIKLWVKNHLQQINDIGFNPKPETQVLQELLSYIKQDTHKWEQFITTWDRVLVTKLNAGFIGKKNHKCGFGWLFLINKHTEETNLETIIFSNQYDDIKLPDKFLDFGNRVTQKNGEDQQKVFIVVKQLDLHRYFICPETVFRTEHQAECTREDRAENLIEVVESIIKDNKESDNASPTRS